MLWYTQTFGHLPRYDHLLEELASTPTERQQILRDFFQPDSEEREAGEKLPSLAHRSIARLVATGHVRIVVTLNFDRLVEQALREEGIEPTVVATPDDMEGLPPPHTLDALVVHLHGDYLTPRSMLNTEAELAGYDARVEDLLGRLLRDYGVVAIGWSAIYDPQLCAAIARSINPHATGYWVEPHTLGEKADELRANKKYHLVQDTAESFLAELADTVGALSLRGARHPLTVAVAVATAKRQLRGDRPAVEIHDRFNAEVARVDEMPEMNRQDPGRPLDGQTAEQLFGRIEEATMVSAALAATCAYWGNHATDSWWLPAIERWATPVSGSGPTRLIRAANIPATILNSAALTAAVASGRYDLAQRVLTEPHVTTYYNTVEPAATSLAPASIYVDTANPHARVHEMLGPIFVDELGLTRRAYDEAWETGETLRDVTLLWIRTRKIRVLEVAAQAAINLAHAGQQLDRSRVDSTGSSTEATNVVDNAQRALDQAVNDLAGYLSPTGHVRVREDHAGFNWHYKGVVASDMASRLDRQQGASPLVEAGIADARPDNVYRLRVLLHAVALAQGATAHRYWRNSGTTRMDAPQQFWLDTLTTAEGHR